MQSIDDNTLITRAQEGDDRATEALVRRYQEFAFRTAFVITRNEEDARDAAQLAMFKAVDNLDRFRTGSPFKPWLARIVANEAKDRKTISIRQSGFSLREEGLDSIESPEQTPASAAERSEENALLVDAINRLKVDDRLILAYRFFLDMSEADMAEALECPRGTVKSRLSRAMQRLRVVIAEDTNWFDDGAQTNG